MMRACCLAGPPGGPGFCSLLFVIDYLTLFLKPLYVMRTNVNKFILGLTGLVVVLLIIGHFQGLVGPVKETEERVKLPYLFFEQIGYFKSESKLRYFTFYVSHGYDVVNDSLPVELESRIRSHGASRMHTDGCTTASFYYFDKGAAPDITLLSAQFANDLAHDRKPIMSVWILPAGRVNSFINPWKND